MVKCSALYAGSASEASSQAVLVYGNAPKVISLGLWDMYSLALRGSVMGLQCITLLILNQLQRASYNVSGMCHGSSYFGFIVCLCCLCSFRSLVKDSLQVVMLWRNMTSDSAFGREIVVSCGCYMFESLRSLGLVIMDMRRPSGPCISTVSAKVGWVVSSNVPVGTASRTGLMGCVV